MRPEHVKAIVCMADWAGVVSQLASGAVLSSCPCFFPFFSTTACVHDVGACFAQDLTRLWFSSHCDVTPSCEATYCVAPGCKQCRASIVSCAAQLVHCRSQLAVGFENIVFELSLSLCTLQRCFESCKSLICFSSLPAYVHGVLV